MFKKERLQGILIGVIITSVFAICTVFAEQTSKVIDAVYMNVKLVVDGIQIEPKDGNGNYVEPFIYNGTTYLPVRAVGQAFNKEVSWDGETATVYVGGKVDKPAKDVLLYNRPYIEVNDPNGFKAYEEKGHNYVGFYMDDREDEEVESRRYRTIKSVIYPLNGVAKKVKGTLLAGDQNNPETVYKFYDESGKILYQSPKMIPTTEPIDFEIDVTNCISLKIEISNTCGSDWDNNTLLIKNLTLTTTDYK